MEVGEQALTTARQPLLKETRQVDGQAVAADALPDRPQGCRQGCNAVERAVERGRGDGGCGAHAHGVRESTECAWLETVLQN